VAICSSWCLPRQLIIFQQAWSNDVVSNAYRADAWSSNVYVSLLHLKGCWPAEYHPDDSLHNLSVLGPNHTHFILVDDGTQPTYYKDNDLRSKLEKLVSQMNTAGSRGRSLVVITFFICNAHIPTPRGLSIHVFTALRFASAVLANAIPSVCPSVRPSVCLSVCLPVCRTQVLCQNDCT